MGHSLDRLPRALTVARSKEERAAPPAGIVVLHKSVHDAHRIIDAPLA